MTVWTIDWPFGPIEWLSDQWPIGLPTCRTIDHSDKCTIFGLMNHRTNDHSEYRAVPMRSYHAFTTVRTWSWGMIMTFGALYVGRGRKNPVSPVNEAHWSSVPGRFDYNIKLVTFKITSRRDIQAFHVKLLSGECQKISRMTGQQCLR